MKKIYLTITFMFISPAIAQGYLPPGGLSPETTVNAPGTEMDGLKLPSILKSLVPINQVGKPFGVAGLSAKGAITAPLASIGSSEIKDPNGKSILVINPTQSDDNKIGKNYWNLMKPHAVLVGGSRVGTISNNNFGPDSQLYIVGHADGMGGQGCLLCILDGPGSITDFLPGISSNWNTLDGISSYGSADQSLEYISSSNKPATVSLQASGYTENEVILKYPMTDSEINRIHYGMYVMTNIIDPKIKINNFSEKNNLPLKNYYASIVDHIIDSTHIQVIGWSVIGGRNPSAGQIPDISNVDKVWTNFGVPMVGIGANTGSGIFNWRIDHNDVSDSWVHEYGAEYDINNFSSPSSMRVTGLTLVEGGNAPSADSWGIAINAPQNPDLLELDGGKDSKIINSPGAFLVNGSGLTSNSAPDHEFGEWDAFLAPQDNIRLVNFIHHNGIGLGYTSAEVYIGAHANDIFGKSPLLASSGVMMGALGLNIGGNIGSASLCGGAGTNKLNCSLRVDGDGSIKTTGSIFISGNIDAKGIIVGKTVIQASGDTTIAGNLMAPGLISSGDVNAKNDIWAMQGFFRERLYTPASSSDKCVEGQFTDDSNYHYVCVANNSWKRVALTSW